MSGIPYLPLEDSRLGPVEPAYISPDQTNLAFGLFPCSKVNEVFGRHGAQCWGTGPSQWLNQSDASASCIWEQKLDHVSAYYTTPRTNQITHMSGLSPIQVGSVEGSATSHPPCAPTYPGLTSSWCPRRQ